MINLSKHIEILLLSNDCVIVPGFGGFMAHHIDARKDLSDGSFLPPIRSIGFNPKLTLNDSLLAQSYVEAYDISYPEAVMRIEEDVRELRQRIAKDGSYEFTDIGIICLNDDGNLEFKPCEAGIISPSLYGLGSFGMMTLDDIRTKLNSSVFENTEELKGNHADAPSLPQVRQKSDKADTEKIHYARIIALWRNLAVACIAVIIIMLIPSPLVNNSQLAGSYINTALLDRVLPKDVTTGGDKVAEAVRSNNLKKNNTEAKADSLRAGAKEKVSREGRFSIVMASRVSKKNAEAYVNNLRSRGFTDVYVYKKENVKVLFGHYTSRSAAANALNSLNDHDEFAGAWITEI